MLKKTVENVSWLEFELFSDFKNLKHGVLLKHGGCSVDSFASLNLSFNQTHLIENKNVKKNRDLIKNVFSLNSLNDCIIEHGNVVVEVTEENLETRPKGDGLTTSLKNAALMVTHADCQAAIFFDPITQSLACVHAGWRGNVQNIYANTILKMSQCYGAKPKNILVGISPSLGPQSAEFIHYEKELPPSMWDYKINRCHFDLWKISRSQLQEAGILAHHIQIAKIDTYTNPQDYFSYRREKVSGRHGTFCMMK